MKNNRKNDFQTFLKSSPSSPPTALTEQLLDTITDKLDPPIGYLMSKIALIQLLIGSITLFFCPQFGWSFNQNKALYLNFQQLLGPYGCMIACGVVFTSFATLTTVLVLNKAELKKVFHYQWYIFPAMAVVLVALFSILRQEFYLNMNGLWVIGALIGYFAIFDSGFMLKIKSGHTA